MENKIQISATPTEAAELWFALQHPMCGCDSLPKILRRNFTVELPEGLSKFEYTRKYRGDRSLSETVEEWKSKLKVFKFID